MIAHTDLPDSRDEEAWIECSWNSLNEVASSLTRNFSEPDWLEHLAIGEHGVLSLAPEIGQGQIEFVHFGNGLKLVVFDAVWHTPQHLRVHDGNLIRFNVSLDITMDMRRNDKSMEVIEGASSRIINNPSDVPIREIVYADTPARWVTVCCDPATLAELCGLRLDDLPIPLRGDSVSESGGLLMEWPLTAPLRAIALDLLRGGPEGSLRMLHLYSRSLDLICRMMEGVLTPPEPRSGDLQLKQAEIDAIREVEPRLRDTLANPPTVKDLARIAGMNRNKLHNGFRQVYGMTIGEFIKERRLERAVDLIGNTDMSFGDIAHAVGFTHQCNFSSAIKKQTGYSPRELRKLSES